MNCRLKRNLIFLISILSFYISYAQCGSESNLTTIETNLVDLEICDGEEAYFEVLATGDELKYQWYFDEMAISREVSSVLSILPAHTINHGKYYVGIYGKCDTVFSDTVNLRIKEIRPSTIGLLSQDAICEGWNLTLTAESSIADTSIHYTFIALDGTLLQERTDTNAITLSGIISDTTIMVEMSSNKICLNIDK